MALTASGWPMHMPRTAWLWRKTALVFRKHPQERRPAPQQEWKRNHWRWEAHGLLLLLLLLRRDTSARRQTRACGPLQ